MNADWVRRHRKGLISGLALILLLGAGAIVANHNQPKHAASLNPHTYRDVCKSSPQNSIPPDVQEVDPLTYVFKTLNTLDEQAGKPLGDKKCVDIFPVSTAAVAMEQCVTPIANQLLRWCPTPVDATITGIPEASGKHPYFYLDTQEFNRWIHDLSIPPNGQAAILLSFTMQAYAHYLHRQLTGQSPDMSRTNCYLGAFATALRDHADRTVLSLLLNHQTPEFKQGQKDPTSCAAA